MADVDKKKIKKKRSTAKGNFHRIYNWIHDIKDDTSKGDDIIEGFADLRKAYTKLEESHEEYIGVLDSDDEAEGPIIKTISDDMKITYGEYCNIRSIAKGHEKKQLEDDNAKKLVKPKVEAKMLKDGLKVTKLNPPRFDGNIRDYPSFKREYENHMQPTYGDDPFALKTCLFGEALKVVRGVDDEFHEMFKRLDMKYGRPEKLVDAVLNDLRKLKKVNEGEESRFIAMVETVERGWLSLRQMKMEDEMNTVTMVSQIERLLPPTQKRE